MKNKVFVIICFTCVFLTFFLGTGWTLGNMVTDKAPRIADTLTSAPDGSDYTVWKLINECAIDLVPLAWIPEAAIIAGTGNLDFGYSTFSKLFKTVKILAEVEPVSMMELTVDLSSLAGYNQFVPYTVSVFKQDPDQDHAAVRLGAVKFGEVQKFYVEKDWYVFFETDFGSDVASNGKGLYVTTPKLRYVPQTSEVWITNQTYVEMWYNKSPIFSVYNVG